MGQPPNCPPEITVHYTPGYLYCSIQTVIRYTTGNTGIFWYSIIYRQLWNLESQFELGHFVSQSIKLYLTFWTIVSCFETLVTNYYDINHSNVGDDNGSESLSPVNTKQFNLHFSCYLKYYAETPIEKKTIFNIYIAMSSKATKSSFNWKYMGIIWQSKSCIFDTGFGQGKLVCIHTWFTQLSHQLTLFLLIYILHHVNLQNIQGMFIHYMI